MSTFNTDSTEQQIQREAAEQREMMDLMQEGGNQTAVTGDDPMIAG